MLERFRLGRCKMAEARWVPMDKLVQSKWWIPAALCRRMRMTLVHNSYNSKTHANFTLRLHQQLKIVTKEWDSSKLFS
jgi:hypothetical protein